MGTNNIGRNEILNKVISELKPLDYVNAMWQCGSKAFDRVDDWSDIDAAVDVDDDRVRDIFPIIDKAVAEILEVECTFECPQTMSSGGWQKVYKFKGLSEYLVLELCAVKHSATDKFIQREIHGDIKVLFDKKNVTEHVPMDKEMFAKRLETRIEKLEQLFTIYQFLTKKELNRGNYVEAMGFFMGFSVAPLMELLRIEHNPYRHSFRHRYVYYDLPEDIAKRLERYYFVKDGDDLREKHEEVIAWFNETLERVKKINLIEHL